MKKIGIIFLLVASFILIGCSDSEGDVNTYSLIVPNGSTSIAQLYMEANSEALPFNYSVERVSGPEALVAAFTSESHDFIIAPSVLGAKLYNAQTNYKLIGTVSYGNLFLATTQKLDSITDINGLEVVAFGQMATPDIVLKKILDFNALVDNVSITYVSSSQATLLELLRDSAQIVLISEPFLSMAKEEIQDLNILNLSQVWENDLGLTNFPQAALYANNNLTNDAIEAFTTELKTSINYANNNPNQTGILGANLEYPFESEIISHSIHNSQLNFITANEAKIDFVNFYTVILDYNALLIGNQLPDESYYRDWDQE